MSQPTRHVPPQPGDFVAQPPAECEPDCQVCDILADSDTEDEDIADFNARQFIRTRQEEAATAAGAAALAAAAPGPSAAFVAGLAAATDSPLDAIDRLIAIGAVARAAELAAAAKADVIAFAAEVGLELSAMRCGKDGTCGCKLAFYLADPTRFKKLLQDGKDLQDGAARLDPADRELPTMKHAVQGGSSMLTADDVEAVGGLRQGCTVRICGMASNWGKEVNGSEGLILSVDSAGTRFAVELSSGEVHNLRAGSLELLEEKLEILTELNKLRDTGLL